MYFFCLGAVYSARQSNEAEIMRLKVLLISSIFKFSC